MSKFEQIYDLISKKKFFKFLSSSLPILFVLILFLNIILLFMLGFYHLYGYTYDLQLCLDRHISMPLSYTISFIINFILATTTLITSYLIMINFFKKKENKNISICFILTSLLFFLSSIIDCIMFNYSKLMVVTIITSTCISAISVAIFAIYKPFSIKINNKIDLLSKEILSLENQILNRPQE